MKFPRFELERWQSTYEHSVEYNLSESGVHPATMADIGIDPAEMASIRLGYSQANGTETLRSLAAGLCPGATSANILATIGGAEANLLTLLYLIEPGDEVVVVLPNYMQIPGLTKALGAKLVPVWLRLENQWLPDPEEIASAVTARTKLIAVCNPNNPTGIAFGVDRIQAIAAVAARAGCWILSDEVYQGAEVTGVRTPSFWGSYERVIVINSMSKAYGTPGLRLGWLLGPSAAIQDLWSYADYTRIAPATLSDWIGCRVLQNRERMLARTRSLIDRNWPNLVSWLDERPGRLEYIRPHAGAFCMVRYNHPIRSLELAERLRVEKSTLIVPGEHFLMDGFIRFGFGAEPSYTRAGLERVGQLLDSI